MASPPPRALVIGAGVTSNLIHLPQLARLRDRGAIALVAICDIDAARAEAAHRRFGFSRAHGDALAAIVQADIDLVYVFGSAEMHYRLGLAALKAGKHLFIEKPVAPGFAQIQELVATARANNCIAAGGHNRRFQSAIQHLRGKPWQMGEAVFHKPEHGKSPPFGASDWLMANGIHALDALLFVMGDAPTYISASAQAECFLALLRWADGRQGVFSCNNQAGARREKYDFHAPGLSCHIRAEGLVTARNGKAGPAMPSTDGFATEHEAFLKAVQTGVQPEHALASLAPSLHIAALIARGYAGEVELPGACHTPSASRYPVLVLQPDRLIGALDRLVPYQLVAPQDVTGPRPDIIAIIAGRAEALSPDLLARLPNLKVIAVAALSLERMGEDAFLKRGITLLNASNTYADSVAEFALGLIILARRRAFFSHTVMRQGGWGSDPVNQGLRGRLIRIAKRMKPLVLRRAPGLIRLRPVLAPHGGIPRDLKGASVGLIGWGANARALAQRLVQAGAKVLVWSEHGSAEEIAAVGAGAAPLALAMGASVVSLHRRLTLRTRHAIGASELDLLQPGAVLINVARADLIEPKALLARLKRGDVFACLDVFTSEPPPANDLLRRLPNVFLTSHIAGGSSDMHREASQEVITKILKFLEQV